MVGTVRGGRRMGCARTPPSGHPGRLTANGRAILVEHAGAFLLVAHEHHERAELAIELDENVVCEAICFTPGTARG